MRLPETMLPQPLNTSPYISTGERELWGVATEAHPSFRSNRAAPWTAHPGSGSFSMSLWILLFTDLAKL